MSCTKYLLPFVLACMIGGLFSLKAPGQDAANERSVPETGQADEDASSDNHADGRDDEVEQFESFDEFRKANTAKFRAYSARYRAAKTQELKNEVFKTKPSSDPYLDQVETFLRQGTAEEAEKIAKWWMHGSRGMRDGQRVLGALLETHADAEFMTGFVPRANYSISAEKAEAFHRTILQKNNHDSVKASATFYLQALLGKEAQTLQGEKAKALMSEIESLQNSIKNDYPEMVDLFGVTFVDRVEGSVFASNLAIGKMAPELAGSDLDGVDFKLSDYKGKVTVVDFWGVW